MFRPVLRPRLVPFNYRFGVLTDDSLNKNIESTESEDCESLKGEERVSSHGRPVRDNSLSGVERPKMSVMDYHIVITLIGSL